MSLINLPYRLVDMNGGNVIIVWGDPTGGIQFKVNNGGVHHLDEDVALQTRVLEAILDYYLKLKPGFQRQQNDRF